MGEVYEGENIVSRRRYALKTLTRTAAATRGFAERFRNEASIISDLDHPGVVRVHHVGEADGFYCLTMDFIRGPGGAPHTLEDELEAGRPEEARVRTWSLDICCARGHAHERGVVHRNLKPSNVMVDPKGRIKMADFGLAKVVGTEFLQRSIQRSLSFSMAGEIEGLRRTRPSAPRIAAVALALVAVTVAGPYAFRACRTAQTRHAPADAPARIRQHVSPVRPEARRHVNRSRSLPSTVPEEGRDWTSPSTGMRFVWVSAMKIWVAKYETTNDEYRWLVPDLDSRDYQGMSLNGARQPVVQVTVDDARKFADWMPRRDRETGTLPEGLHLRLPSEQEWKVFARCGDDREYRLPSEREWQLLAQCGDGREYPWGGPMPPSYGNHADGSAMREFPKWTMIDGHDDGAAVACEVERNGKNDWGLYGVGGNVWKATAGTHPAGPSVLGVVPRGGTVVLL